VSAIDLADESGSYLINTFMNDAMTMLK